MRFESCLAVLLTSFIVLASGSNDGDDNNPNIMAVGGKILHLKHHGDNRNWSDGVTKKRSKRSRSDIERNTVLSYFNYQRGLVGASDMNYVGYDVALEADLDVWTSGCNYDAPIQVPNNVAGIGNFTASYPVHSEVIQNVFNTPSYFYGVRSIYVTGAAASVAYCPTLIAGGKQVYNVYLTLYGITTRIGLYNGYVQQYTIGPACTRCQSNVAWCYYNLCRADCSFSISGCCQISNGMQTSNCATTTPSTSFKNGRNGAPGIQAIGTAILHGFLLFICYFFQ